MLAVRRFRDQCADITLEDRPFFSDMILSFTRFSITRGLTERNYSVIEELTVLLTRGVRIRQDKFN
jgi:hypothetical protein